MRCISALLLLAVAGFSSPALGQEAKTRRALSEAEKAVIVSAVEEKVIDPTSLIYRWPGFAPRQPGRALYCGRVNGKNRFGGYVGFVPFSAWVHFDGKAIVSVENLSLGKVGDDFDIITPMCAAVGYDVGQK